VYEYPVPDPPDAVALRTVDWPLSMVIGDEVTVIAGLTFIVTELDADPDLLSVAVSVMVYVPEAGNVKVLPFLIAPEGTAL
jgi:hypothetical protein